MMASLTLALLAMMHSFAYISSKDCPPLSPPEQGVLKCQHTDGEIQCISTCYGPRSFDTGEQVVVRTCDQTTGTWVGKASTDDLRTRTWIGGDHLPACVDGCRDRLLTGYYTSDGLQVPKLTASSDAQPGAEASLSERAIIDRMSYTVWTASKEDLAQFIQVEFPVTTRINGVVIRGNGVADFVTSFRVLFSNDGDTWYPYTDGKSDDTFFFWERRLCL